MLFADFLKAAIPDAVTCLGVRLRPLSLGSMMLLFRLQNVYAIHTPEQIKEAAEPPALHHLLQAVIVCSLTFEAAQAALADPSLDTDLRIWEGKLRGNFWQRHFSSQAERKRFQLRIKKANGIFADYLAAGSRYPCTKAERGPEKPVGSEWPILTLTALMADLNQELSTAINQPLALSRWLVASNSERQGYLEIVERGEMASLQAEADQIAREEMEGKKPA